MTNHRVKPSTENHENVSYFTIFLYTQQQKKRENVLLLNLLKIKYDDFKKYILHVRLTVCYTVSFHVTYISRIQHILFSINLIVTKV